MLFTSPASLREYRMNPVLIHRILEAGSDRFSPKSEVDPEVLTWLYPLIAQGLATGDRVPLLESGWWAPRGNRRRPPAGVSLAVRERGRIPTPRGPGVRGAAARDPDGYPAPVLRKSGR